MANKDRQKRSARQARAREREALEAAQAASAPATGKKSAKSVAKAAPTKEEIAKKENSLFGRIRRYFRDVRNEMHRVVWPSRAELQNYSLAVIAMLIVFGVVVWLVDTGFVAILVGFTGLRG
ncbi:MAG: preprotein translocase subunit SecE [Coriobacteriales bacterium]|nr:preprotein translocase subunit SecE [Coriobacteriales bacterium]